MAIDRRAFQDLLHDQQHNRILRLSFPNDDAPRAQFLVNRIDAEEYLSRDFVFTVELLADDPNIALKDMLAKLLNIELVRQDGSLRYFSGYVFSFRRCRCDGGVTFYEAILGPWLKFLALRNDSYLFHGMRLRAQADDIFRDYGVLSRWEWRVTAQDPVMHDACQFNESDFNYLSRRWEDAGWYYWYEHDAAGHTLIIGCNSTLASPIDGGADVRFHGEGNALEEDAIDYWSQVRHVAVSSVALNSFNFKNARPRSVTTPTVSKQGLVPLIESYGYAGAYGFKDWNHGNALSLVRMEEVEAIAKHIDARGNNRFLMPGRWFRLLGHFNYGITREASRPGKDEFLIISVRHTATNNYLQTVGEKVSYRNWATCSARSVPWRPGRHFNSTETRILAPQTAIVVGDPGQDSICTDEYGRVRVQFHWDRKGSNDDRSSAWIRVSSAWAGAEFGAAAIPRVGTEVVVQWLDGCPDRPIITGAVFNGNNMPPWDVPGQRALTGLRSRELGSGGSSADGRGNHLILDDTSGEIQAQLRSDHQHSQLSLGLITRIEDHRGRRDRRGEGWELRTDGHGVARAAKGLLITTEVRQAACGTVKEMGETVRQLDAAQALHDAQATSALKGFAQDNGQQHSVADVLKAQNDAIRGAGEQFPELAEPHLVLSSPAGIELASTRSTHIASGEHTALTAGHNLSIAAGDSLYASIRQTLRLFVHKAGMKFIAAAGKITVQAHDDDIQVIADKVLALISQSDWVDIRGRKGVRLHGPGAMVEITDRMQVFAPKPTLFHGNLETLAPQNRPQPSQEHKITIDEAATPEDPKQLVLTLQTHRDSGRPIANMPYKLFKNGSRFDEGITDDLGRIAIKHTKGTQAYSVELANGDRYDLAASEKFDSTNHALYTEQSLSSQGARALDGSADGRTPT